MKNKNVFSQNRVFWKFSSFSFEFFFFLRNIHSKLQEKSNIEGSVVLHNLSVWCCYSECCQFSQEEDFSKREKKPHLDLILVYTEKVQPYQPSRFEGKGGKHLKKSIFRENVFIFRCLLCAILIFFRLFHMLKVGSEL